MRIIILTFFMLFLSSCGNNLSTNNISHDSNINNVYDIDSSDNKEYIKNKEENLNNDVFSKNEMIATFKTLPFFPLRDITDELKKCSKSLDVIKKNPITILVKFKEETRRIEKMKCFLIIGFQGFQINNKKETHFNEGF